MADHLENQLKENPESSGYGLDKDRKSCLNIFLRENFEEKQLVLKVELK
jgi:hypothetical protein